MIIVDPRILKGHWRILQLPEVKRLTGQPINLNICSNGLMPVALAEKRKKPTFPMTIDRKTGLCVPAYWLQDCNIGAT